MTAIRYFLRADWGSWTEVDRKTWVRAERTAGFRPNGLDFGQEATSSFSNGTIQGRLVYVGNDAPENWDWDPAFAEALRRQR